MSCEYSLNKKYSINNLSLFHSCIELYLYEFPNGKGGIEGEKFIVGGSDHKFQTVEIEVFQIV